MAHSYICAHVHYIFSTKHRQKIITPELQTRLWPYMGGIARENNMKALAIGGIEDHVHILLSLPSTITDSIDQGRLVEMGFRDVSFSS